MTNSASVMEQLGSWWADDVWSPIVNHWLPSVVAPGLVAALVTVALFWWIQRARADLQMIKIGQTTEVAKWMERASQDTDQAALDARTYWQPNDIVLLTNYGDGTAYNIKFSGSNCRPRVWTRSTGQKDAEGAEITDGLPMWSDRLAALGPGKMWSVVVMSSPDQSVPRPVLEVSWATLPKRRIGCGKFGRSIGTGKRSFDLGTANIIETGWPGKAG
jgi:hypothetical protein